MIFGQDERRTYWLLFGLAALSYLITLFAVQYTGEEAVYTITAYEMWYDGQALAPTQYGIPYLRPPLYNWLIIGITSLIGWKHALVAARLVSALATLASGLLLAGFVRRLWGDRVRAAFCALVFITLWDVLGYYGWLAYSDPVFALCTLAAMLAAWLAVAERRAVWFVPALLAAGAGFLTKALTAYVFYGVALGVVVWQARAWRFAVSPKVILIHVLGLIVPLCWYAVAPTGQGMAGGMTRDILGKLAAAGVGAYLHQVLMFPVQTFANLMPLGAVACWVAWRVKRGGQPVFDTPTRLAGWIALINFLPYWLAPQSGGRYLLPLYGLCALVIAAPLFATPASRRLTLRWAVAIIAFKYLAAAWLFPAYTHAKRADVAAIAADIQQRTAGMPLYAVDDAWVGLSVVSTLDMARVPAPPLRTPPADLRDGFIIAGVPDARLGQVARAYKGTFLLCRGTACEAARRVP